MSTRPNKQWSNDFYRIIEDFEYEAKNYVDTYDALLKLGFSHEQALWLLEKMTENRSPLLDD